MKMQVNVAFLCAMLLVLGGCRSVSSRVDLSPTHYTVTVMILELSKEAEQVLNTSSQPNPDVVSKRWDAVHGSEYVGVSHAILCNFNPDFYRGAGQEKSRSDGVAELRAGTSGRGDFGKF